MLALKRQKREINIELGFLVFFLVEKSGSDSLKMQSFCVLVKYAIRPLFVYLLIKYAK
jgi:hypothetical protein